MTEFQAELINAIKELTEAVYAVGIKICQSNGMVKGDDE